MVRLPSGLRARIEDVDAWGVIVDDQDGAPWRGTSYFLPDGTVMTREPPVEVVAAAVLELVELDRGGRLEEYGLDLS